MRPKRLELEGFASFREPTVLDLSGADLFVLTGPTGSGKSSLIDALTFALYGSVPRYDDRRLVAPVITQGRQEARVRLDFGIGGSEFTAVRVVRRTASGGATTREARLERDGDVLAGNADELTAAVEGLIGLPFEHFTKCVVLPQGEFAQFLHDRPKARQDLLVELLDLDLYRRMAQAANARARSADEQAAWRRRRLAEELARATPEALEAVETRIVELERLVTRIDGLQPRLATLRQEIAAAGSLAAASLGWVERLESLAVPSHALALAERMEAARAGEKGARALLGAARKAREEAETARGALPAEEAPRKMAEAFTARADLARELETTKQALRDAREEESVAVKVLADAVDGEEAARAHLTELGRINAAGVLAQGLAVGDRCPVCGSQVTELPHIEPPEDLKRGQKAVDRARETRRRAGEAERSARAEVATLEGQAAERSERLSELDAMLADAPSPARVRETLEEIHEAEAALAEALSEERRAVDVLTAAGDALSALEGERNEAWGEFQEARDVVTGLGPPPVDQSDLAAAWEQLVSWSLEEAPRRHEEAAKEAARAAELQAEHDELMEQILEACAEAGLEPGEGGPRDSCAEALAAARQVYERLQEEIEEVSRLQQEAGEYEEASQIASSLARHLGARRFEAWVLNRAMGGLIAGASRMLLELSSGQYSLALDPRSSQFLVVDHANADEARLARTLSGGETFLASLSLALSLAEHVSQLAARGAARLEALFLDEGFGTLDTDTLDIVAAALEELGARGRMVGLVTHVRDLAERMPLRFEVVKGARTSTVERLG